MAWHQTDLRPNTAGYFFNKLIYPNVKGEPADEKLVNEQWKQSMKAFKAIENYFLKDRPFIAGEEISIADLLGVCEIVQVGSVNVDFAKDYPVMKAWIQRVRNETNPNFDEVHKILYKIGKITDPSKL
ncbi:Glutathione S-transferase T1 [Holothuria leucospilota]|uniref:Glutathione S-transferase T1 n=1 Tax=Holothuria leucospilota TaxID=206669 RepID=A0A9Q1CE20_HOLLE|nr:Glutathione S-transferase T1 [Holothuria leucospilota]